MKLEDLQTDAIVRGILPDAAVIGLSGELCKNVHKIDRKLQGRILVAITEISDDPLAARGDTVKPLTGKMKGLWRFRIGDYRLIYNPDASRRRIALVAFASRGSIYGE